MSLDERQQDFGEAPGVEGRRHRRGIDDPHAEAPDAGEIAATGVRAALGIDDDEVEASIGRRLRRPAPTQVAEEALDGVGRGQPELFGIDPAVGLDGPVRAEGAVGRLSAYAQLLDRLTVMEVRGGWDFAALRDLGWGSPRPLTEAPVAVRRRARGRCRRG